MDISSKIVIETICPATSFNGSTSGPGSVEALIGSYVMSAKYAGRDVTQTHTANRCPIERTSGSQKATTGTFLANYFLKLLIRRDCIRVQSAK